MSGTVQHCILQQRGHTDVVQVLLSRNDLNTGLRNKDGNTAADLALSKGYTEIHQMITYHTFS
jgi:ankyrin repeat protein